MPFGPNCEFKTFKQCTSEHSDKENPGAYCAVIKGKTEAKCAKKRGVLSLRDLAEEENGFTWDPEQRVYLDANGDTVDRDEVRGALDAYLGEQGRASDRLANRLAQGGSDLGTWQGRFKALLLVTIGAGFVAGRGGRKQMTAADKTTLGNTVAGQYSWLDGFARDLSQGQQTVAQLLARARQYITAGRIAFERGLASTYDELDLPVEPGVGCQCGSRCRCHWDIEEYRDRWECYYVASNDPSTCGDCGDRSSDYSPYIQYKVGVTAEE